MREPDDTTADPHVDENGAHLAAALHRMAANDGVDVYDHVALDAARLTDIRKVDVDLDDRRDILTLQAQLGRGPMLPARSLSDGTLRFLALCIMRLDADFGGLLCMEEPENGIHPGRVEEMVDLVRSLSVDAQLAPGPSNPFRQVMVNTHSPHFVRAQQADDLLAAQTVTVRRDGVLANTVRLVSLPGTWRSELPNSHAVSREALIHYLTEPPTALFAIENQ